MANPSHDKGNAAEHADFSDETIRHRFFRDLVESERLAVFKAFGVYPPGCTDRLDHSIERRLLNRILRRATTPSPSTAPELMDRLRHAALDVLEAQAGGAVRLEIAGEPPLYVLAGTEEMLKKLEPSTAPEVDERAAFEAWHAEHGNVLAKQSQYWAWKGRAALASRPAEVDDEGLPKLPEPGINTASHIHTRIVGYTAEQYRQGQRDAVAADRARRGDGWISLSDERPEVGEIVLVSSEGWRAPRALKYRVQPWESFLDAEQGRWFWYPERMLWKRFPAPSHTTNKENG